MNLLTKTTLYFITVSLFVFFLGGIAVYQLIKVLENNKVNRELLGQMQHFSHDLSQSQTDLQNTTIISGGLININPALEMTEPVIQFSDTLIFNSLQSKYVLYRRISFYTVHKNRLYHVQMYKSLIESDFLIEKVAMIVTLMVMVFLLAVYFLYRYFFKQIWLDFFISVDKIRLFDLSKPEKINFTESTIVEFNQLNTVLQQMTERMVNDYSGLKEFTANLSHEIQTPLAIIKSKNELIQQNEQLPEELFRLSVDIQSQVIRLSRLIKALSLLAKIDNHQFSVSQTVNVSEIISNILSEYQNIIDLKEIELQVLSLSDIQLKINRQLAEILFLNLLKNSVKHNFLGGKITIELTDEFFQIKNTGNEPLVSPQKYFNRFVKANQNSESLGIGLSIVKKICNLYDFEISYEYSEKMHEIKISFNHE